MSSRFNVLYRGSAEDAAEELEDGRDEATVDELRLALINALQKLHNLEYKVSLLEANRDSLLERVASIEQWSPDPR